ncbi:MAG: metal-dependent transcriptional regulator [Anaerolineales bacterium]
MQRYTAEIYRLQQDYPFASLSMVAEQVNASLQAVSRMIGRLQAAGLLKRQPYKGVRLTPVGEMAAMPVIRRHRLAEVFLVKVMKFGWEEAHELTGGFELGIDQKLEDRIEELTGYPTRCPHGEPIPTKDGFMPVLNDHSMTTLESGDAGHISRVRTHDKEKLRYLAREGLVPGEGFRVLVRGPFDGPLRILVDRREYVLGHELSAVIWVETINGEIAPRMCNRAGCPLPKATGSHQYVRPEK